MARLRAPHCESSLFSIELSKTELHYHKMCNAIVIDGRTTTLQENDRHRCSDAFREQDASLLASPPSSVIQSEFYSLWRQTTRSSLFGGLSSLVCRRSQFRLHPVEFRPLYLVVAIVKLLCKFICDIKCSSTQEFRQMPTAVQKLYPMRGLMSRASL